MVKFSIDIHSVTFRVGKYWCTWQPDHFSELMRENLGWNPHFLWKLPQTKTFLFITIVRIFPLPQISLTSCICSGMIVICWELELKLNLVSSSSCLGVLFHSSWIPSTFACILTNCHLLMSRFGAICPNRQGTNIALWLPDSKFKLPSAKRKLWLKLIIPLHASWRLSHAYQMRFVD